MTVQKLNCPTCGKPSPVSKATHLPFCSERCRLIDLGRWLEEDHSVPASSSDSSEDRDPVHNVPEDNQRPPVRLPPGWHDA